MKGYFSTSISPTLEINDALGRSTIPYICVTKSRTISFLTSGFNLFLDKADIMLGFHLEGMENSFFFKRVAADDGTDEVENVSDN
jgi:hypothetical protein